MASLRPLPSIESTLVGQLLGHLERRSVELGIIDPPTLAELRELEASMQGFNRAEDKATFLRQRIAAFSAFGEGEEGKRRRLQASNFLAVRTILLNAVTYADQAKTTPTPHDRFKEFLTRGIAQDPAGFIRGLKDAYEQMLISVVQTMHPTIYHNEFALRKEEAITRHLEKALTFANDRSAPIRPEDNRAIQDAQGEIEGLLRHVAAGNPLTPDKKHPATIRTENAAERHNFAAIETAIREVAQDWNRALRKTAQHRDLTDEQRLMLADLQLTEEALREKFESRTWARGADADGRERSTSPELYRAIKEAVEKGEYQAPKLDLRQNAEVHAKVVSALIQRKFRSGIMDDSPLLREGLQDSPERVEDRDFVRRCLEFVDDPRNVSLPDYAPPRFIFQQLSPEGRARFLREILNEGYSFVPEQLKRDTIAFNEKFQGIYDDFLRKYDLNIPPGTALTVLNTVYVAVNGEIMSAYQALQREFMERPIDGRIFSLTEYGVFERPGTGHSNFFQGIRTAPRAKHNALEAGAHGNGSNGASTLKGVKKEDRVVLLDVMRRLIIAEHFISAHGGKVADRHQIANFEEESDFYAMMLILKEAGLIRIENGEVKEVRLSIQPLIETIDDMKNAPAMFGRLLDDPLALSYFRANGNRADIMVGFSDGAKSAGNFASEWEIYRCTQRLSRLFASKGITLRVFQGRGRGPDRGGYTDHGMDMHMMPPEVATEAVLDVTLQSDLPAAMAASPTYGRDVVTDLMLGTLTAKRDADRALQAKQGTEEAMRASYEEACDFIAEESAGVYAALVRHNPMEHTPDVVKFLKAMPDNRHKSSRSAERGATEKEGLDGVRAIPVEYRDKSADGSLHNVGLNTALRRFVESGNTVMDEDGQPVSGEAALQVLYRNFKPFAGLIDKIGQGVRDYRPEVFHSYGVACGTEAFARQVVGELDGLAGQLKAIKRSGRERALVAADGRWLNRARSRLSTQADPHRDINDLTAHAMILASAFDAARGEVVPIRELAKSFNPDEENHPVEARTLSHLTLCVVSEVANRGHELGQMLRGSGMVTTR